VCGRYVQASSPELLVERFGVERLQMPEQPGDREPDYNVAPRKPVPAVIQRDQRVLEELRWGLIPSWATDPRIGDRLINARAETVLEKPAFQHAFRKKRCILPADGFYEWEAVPGQKRKRAVFVHARDGEPFAFAGLWEVWRDASEPDAEWLPTCTIVTTRANEMLQPVHDRMPVILPEKAWDEWLDPTNEDVTGLSELLVPFPDRLIEMWAVGSAVNDANNNGPELLAPLEQAQLFE
jgi:putative SOS response-associated peptidase YedK